MNRHLDGVEFDQYIWDELSGAELEDVEAHLATCSRCQTVLKAQQRMVMRLSRPPDVPAPPGFSSRVMERLPQTDVQRDEPRIGWVLGVQSLLLLILAGLAWPLISLAWNSLTSAYLAPAMIDAWEIQAVAWLAGLITPLLDAWQSMQQPPAALTTSLEQWQTGLSSITPWLDELTIALVAGGLIWLGLNRLLIRGLPGQTRTSARNG